MRGQRNMFQMKKQDKNPEEQLSEVELGNLADRVQGNDHKDALRSW